MFKKECTVYTLKVNFLKNMEFLKKEFLKNGIFEKRNFEKRNFEKPRNF